MSALPVRNNMQNVCNIIDIQEKVKAMYKTNKKTYDAEIS